MENYKIKYTIIELSDKLKIRPKVAIRVNMDTGIQPMWDRFGFNFENGQAWDALNKIMLSDKLDLVGLHTHIGTFMLSAQAYGVAATKLDAGYLLGTVIANKRLSAGKRTTIVDIGVNLLFTSFWYNHRITPAQPFSQYTEETTIYGPLCMNIDVISENINLPLLNKGDHIVIHDVGAYNMTQWMQFITLRPKVVMIDIDGNPHVIRENEKIDTVISLEKIPDYLKKLNL